ncbi:MAG TPA: serine hydrolase domain-containing protein, partial [Pirellulaceae bacterium]|nr:serine hydrolase domain-containing protein [Pirellulaceae bacterium]
MKRRTFLSAGIGMTAAAAAVVTNMNRSLFAALRDGEYAEACEVLEQATNSAQVMASVLHVERPDSTFTRAFGRANNDSMFLLGSISKPIAVASLLTLMDRGALRLDDRVNRYLPAFTGDGRDKTTIQHLLTHVSGLPDQLPENDSLRSKHAPLSEFVEHAVRTPLSFAPGARYQYSSMGILLAARIAEQLSGKEIRTFVDESIFRPLKMTRSAQGLGRFSMGQLVLNQTESAAPEAGGGDPKAKAWDWNSSYWRMLGAPWGGTHCSAPDVAKFLGEFLHQRGAAVRPETARLAVVNRNPPGFTKRGLGFGIGKSAFSPGCSDQTFGHTGSTGTIAWADPATKTICVVLTSLPARAVT